MPVNIVILDPLIQGKSPLEYRFNRKMNIIDCDKKGFQRYINKNTKILLFGARRMAVEAAAELNIQGKIYAIIDSDEKLEGKKIIIGQKCQKIHTPSVLNKEYDSSFVILITSAHVDSIIEILRKYTIASCNINCFIYPYIKTMLEPLSEEFFEKRIVSRCLELYEELLDFEILSDVEKKTAVEEKHRQIVENSSSERQLFIVPSVIYYLTTKCNLQCRDCSALIPYFNKKYDIPAEQVIRDFNLFFYHIDECISVILLGGETFLYKELDKVLDYLICNKKATSIILPTNALILPGKEIIDRLKNKKIFIRISDYGKIDALSRFVSLMESKNIRFQLLTERQWDKTGGIDYRGKTLEQLHREFMHCDISRYVRVIEDGRLHICERSARLFKLGKFTSTHDYIELNENSQILREKIRNIYYADYADVCNYCDRGNFPKEKINGGRQIKNPFPVSNYTIINREKYETMEKQLEECALYVNFPKLNE
jgi:organic radical activating enzyme